MTLLHRIIAWLLLPLALPYFALKPKLRAGLWKRFWLGQQVPLRQRPARDQIRVWAHGASAGDVLCLQPLLEQLSERCAVEILVTAFTGSGVEMAGQRLAAAQVAYQPLDLPGATARAVRQLAPDILLLERAELWPALIRSVHASGAAIAVVNGHIAPGAVTAYRWAFKLIGNPLEEIDLFLMRDEQEAQRAAAIGAPPERVRVTGNTKLDNAVRVAAPEQVRQLGDALGISGAEPILVAGSTHRGEEELVVAAFCTALKTTPGARLILAPRYMERCDEVAAIVARHNLDLVRRSEGRTAAASPVVLLDTMGELGSAYGLARVAFVGGSLVPRGGQNMLEPAAQSVPVIVGPHTEHATDQVDLLRDHGLTVVADGRELERELVPLLSDQERARSLGAEAAQAARAGTGASNRCADHIIELLEARRRLTAQSSTTSQTNAG